MGIFGVGREKRDSNLTKIFTRDIEGAIEEVQESYREIDREKRKDMKIVRAIEKVLESYRESDRERRKKLYKHWK